MRKTTPTFSRESYNEMQKETKKAFSKKKVIDQDFKNVRVMSTEEYEAWRKKVLETDLP